MDLSNTDRYASTDVAATNLNEGYDGGVTLSIGGAWDTLLVGDVSRVVYGETRRLRGVGAAALALDDALGRLRDSGAGYLVRFGPWVFSTALDEDANFDIWNHLPTSNGQQGLPVHGSLQARHPCPGAWTPMIRYGGFERGWSVDLRQYVGRFRHRP